MDKHRPKSTLAFPSEVTAYIEAYRQRLAAQTDEDQRRCLEAEGVIAAAIAPISTHYKQYLFEQTYRIHLKSLNLPGWLIWWKLLVVRLRK
jgi:hypothetical protein